ncbi:VSP [Giardia duodenalis]|uniref:VSP n=1 Tax=Giardia intestinalis (strain ATCC 50803 / WB clone C6) TaxID=184922 RepID=A0A644EZQ7_GIAIC|nr:VSP [Giardia intestinalis]KAE8301612.1 VSP [Giardia intestinalis]
MLVGFLLVCVTVLAKHNEKTAQCDDGNGYQLQGDACVKGQANACPTLEGAGCETCDLSGGETCLTCKDKAQYVAANKKSCKAACTAPEEVIDPAAGSAKACKCDDGNGYQLQGDACVKGQANACPTLEGAGCETCDLSGGETCLTCKDKAQYVAANKKSCKAACTAPEEVIDPAAGSAKACKCDDGNGYQLQGDACVKGQANACPTLEGAGCETCDLSGGETCLTCKDKAQYVAANKKSCKAACTAPEEVIDPAAGSAKACKCDDGNGYQLQGDACVKGQANACPTLEGAGCETCDLSGGETCLTCKDKAQYVAANKKSCKAACTAPEEVIDPAAGSAKACKCDDGNGYQLQGDACVQAWTERGRTAAHTSRPGAGPGKRCRPAGGADGRTVATCQDRPGRGGGADGGGETCLTCKDKAQYVAANKKSCKAACTAPEEVIDPAAGSAKACKCDDGNGYQLQGDACVKGQANACPTLEGAGCETCDLSGGETCLTCKDKAQYVAANKKSCKAACTAPEEVIDPAAGSAKACKCDDGNGYQLQGDACVKGQANACPTLEGAGCETCDLSGGETCLTCKDKAQYVAANKKSCKAACTAPEEVIDPAAGSAKACKCDDGNGYQLQGDACVKGQANACPTLEGAGCETCDLSGGETCLTCKDKAQYVAANKKSCKAACTAPEEVIDPAAGSAKACKCDDGNGYQLQGDACVKGQANACPTLEGAGCETCDLSGGETCLTCKDKAQYVAANKKSCKAACTAPEEVIDPAAGSAKACKCDDGNGYQLQGDACVKGQANACPTLEGAGCETCDLSGGETCLTCKDKAQYVAANKKSCKAACTAPEEVIDPAAGSAKACKCDDGNGYQLQGDACVKGQANACPTLEGAGCETCDLSGGETCLTCKDKAQYVAANKKSCKAACTAPEEVIDPAAGSAKACKCDDGNGYQLQGDACVKGQANACPTLEGAGCETCDLSGGETCLTCKDKAQYVAANKKSCKAACTAPEEVIDPAAGSAKACKCDDGNGYQLQGDACVKGQANACPTLEGAGCETCDLSGGETCLTCKDKAQYVAANKKSCKAACTAPEEVIDPAAGSAKACKCDDGNGYQLQGDACVKGQANACPTLEGAGCETCDLSGGETCLTCKDKAQYVAANKKSCKAACTAPEEVIDPAAGSAKACKCDDGNGYQLQGDACVKGQANACPTLEGAGCETCDLSGGETCLTCKDKAQYVAANKKSCKAACTAPEEVIDPAAGSAKACKCDDGNGYQLQGDACVKGQANACPTLEGAGCETCDLSGGETCLTCKDKAQYVAANKKSCKAACTAPEEVIDPAAGSAKACKCDDGNGYQLQGDACVKGQANACPTLEGAGCETCDLSGGETCLTCKDKAQYVAANKKSCKAACTAPEEVIDPAAGSAKACKCDDGNGYQLQGDACVKGQANACPTLEGAGCETCDLSGGETCLTCKDKAQYVAANKKSCKAACTAPEEVIDPAAGSAKACKCDDGNGYQLQGDACVKGQANACPTLEGAGCETCDLSGGETCLTCKDKAQYVAANKKSCKAACTAPEEVIDPAAGSAKACKCDDGNGYQLQGDACVKGQANACPTLEGAGCETCDLSGGETCLTCKDKAQYVAANKKSCKAACTAPEEVIDPAAGSAKACKCDDGNGYQLQGDACVKGQANACPTLEGAGCETCDLSGGETCLTCKDKAQYVAANKKSCKAACTAPEEVIDPAAGSAKACKCDDGNGYQLQGDACVKGQANACPTLEGAGCETCDLSGGETCLTCKDKAQYVAANKKSCKAACTAPEEVIDPAAGSAKACKCDDGNGYQLQGDACVKGQANACPTLEGAGCETCDLSGGETCLTCKDKAQYVAANKKSCKAACTAPEEVIDPAAGSAKACKCDDGNGYQLQGDACVIPNTNKSSGLSTGAIAGIAVAAVIVVGGLVGFLCWWFLCRGKA